MTEYIQSYSIFFVYDVHIMKHIFTVHVTVDIWESFENIAGGISIKPWINWRVGL